MVFLSVDGLGSADASGAGRRDIAWSAGLRGPDTQPLTWSTGAGAIETDVAAIVEAWGPPAASAGSYVLTIDCLEIARPTQETFCSQKVAEPWRFDFTLPAPTGAVVIAGARSTVGTATLTLAELRITPTMVSSRVGLNVDGTDIDHWGTTTATVRYGDVVFATSGAYA